MTAPGGAHLTGTAETSRPSVFEILSHEGFAGTLKPAVLHIIKILAETDPTGKFAIGYRYFDEIYLGFDIMVQWHYLLTRGATFSEAFYGLERKLTAKTGKLSIIRISYIVSVLVPYVSCKLDKFYKQIIDTSITNEEIDSDMSRSVCRDRQLKKSFALIYPYVKAIIRMTNLFYLLSYTFGRSDHHNLIFRILKMSLGYTSPERSKFMEEKTAELFMMSEWRNLKNVPKLILRSLGESVLWAVEIGTFFIQFLDWWYNDEQQSRITVASRRIPPAPHTKSVQNQKVQNFVTLLPSDLNKCPLCRSDFRNPTAINVSGVVYCYSCIFPYLNQFKKCPLTNLSCNNSNLIRVFR